MSIRTFNTRSESRKLKLLKSLIETFKSMFMGCMAILAFICAPIWNHPERMKILTRWLIALLGILLMLWLMFWLGQRPVFSIKKIQIESNTGENLKHVNLPTIRSMVIGNLSGNFFSIRLDNARTAFESVPWVRSASVRRVWPNGLIVTLEEHEALGIWGGANDARLMNTYGELFIANVAEAEADRKLVQFNGPDKSNHDVLALYNLLNEWFKPWKAKPVEVSLSNRYAWSSKLDNGIRFEFGRDLDQKDRAQINVRMERFFKTWPQIQQQWPGKVDMVDLRYPNGFAIRLNGNKNITDKQETTELAQADNKLTEQKNQIENSGIKNSSSNTYSKKVDKKNVKVVNKNGRSY